MRTTINGKVVRSRKDDGLTFANWMTLVDRNVEHVAGCSVYDLADCCFMDLYDDGFTAGQAARHAIANGF
jgi:hypothetical protein